MASAADKPDFWSVVGQTELQMLAALAKGQLASTEPELTTALHTLKARVPSVQMWDSVYNEAQFTLEPYMAMLEAAEKSLAKKSTAEMSTAEKKSVAEKQAAQRLLESLKALTTA